MQVKFMERLTFGHGQIDEHLSLKPYYDTSLPLVSLQKTSIYYLIFFFLGLTTRLPCALANLARFFFFSSHLFAKFQRGIILEQTSVFLREKFKYC